MVLAEVMEAELQDTAEYKPKFGEPIPIGSRHNTLVSFAAAVLKKFGSESGKAFDLYMLRAGQCAEPMGDDETNSIWQDACSYYEKTVSKGSAYIPPDKFNADFKPLSESPIPFDEVSLPTFPVDALPSKVKAYVEAVAETTQTPVDMSATASLAVMASCMQGKYVVRAKPDWIEPVNLYALQVAEPSERKSAVISHMLRPINQFEAEYNKQHAAELERNKMQKRILEKRQKAIEDQIVKGKADERQLDEIVREIADFRELSPMQLYMDDVTPEKLASVIAEHHGVAAIISAEVGVFDQLAGGMYSKAVNIDVFLKGHAGDTIRIDRIGRNSESVEHPALTMLLAVQPSVLSGLMQNGTFRSRGLTARFLYTVPHSRVGTRKYRTEPILEEAKRQYDILIQNLLDEDNNPSFTSPETISLSKEVDSLLEAFSDEMEQKLRSEYADFADWAGKLCGAVVRISGLLCRAENACRNDFLSEPPSLVISEDVMQRAISIGRYFTEHAKAAYQLMGADPVVRQCKYVLNAIRNSELAELTGCDIMRMCRSFKTAASLQPVLDRLCEYGYLTPKSDETANRRGRPASQNYLLNLALYAA